MNMEKCDLFSTPIGIVKNLGVLKEITDFIATKQPTKNFLNDENVCIEFKKKVIECAKEYMTPHFKFTEVKIHDNWITHNKFTDSTDAHNHPASLIVAVYYIDNAPKCGDLILMDPRSGIRWPEIKEYNVVHNTSSNKNTGTTAKRVYRVSPEKDMLILFPGYLLHSVETNLNPMFIRKSVGINFRVVTERW